MTLKLFYPAPEGLPVVVNPPRGDEEVYHLLDDTDWCRLLQLRSDHLVRSGALWLYGFLEEAHRLTQQNFTSEGAYWHALVHRSEGDFSNALYWLHRVGVHPIHSQLRAGVQEAIAMEGQSLDGYQILMESPQWKPDRLLELCKLSVQGELTQPEILRGVIQMEYNLLMKYVLTQACSGGESGRPFL